MTIKEALEKVAEFQKGGQQTVNDSPTILPYSEVDFRDTLIREEIKETFKAGLDENLVEVLDGLCDIAYVLFGTVNAYGLQHVFEEAFNRVHESNMSKLTGGKLVKDKLTGKVLKPDTFKRVYLEDLV